MNAPSRGGEPDADALRVLMVRAADRIRQLERRVLAEQAHAKATVARLEAETRFVVQQENLLNIMGKQVERQSQLLEALARRGLWSRVYAWLLGRA